MTSELLDAALRYAPRSLPLFGKVPAVGAGWPDWEATPDSLRAWFSAHGDREDANIGIRTGNGLVVLDVDAWDGGIAAFAALEREHGKLPPTPTTVTGSGGFHKFLRGSRNLRSRNLRTVGIDGIELKANGCQVVAPPSVHPDTGRVYCWHPAHPLIESEIAPAPAWLLELAGQDSDAGGDHGDFSDLADRDPLHRIPSERYVERLTGQVVNRHGYIACPFHGGGRELVPSLKVYPRGGWKCYGCGAAGRIYQLAGLLGGYPLPLTSDARRGIRAELLHEFAAEVLAA